MTLIQVAPMKLAGKVAVITGSGRGIGRAAAFALAAEGASVVVNDLDHDVALEAAKALRSSGHRAEVCSGSVTDSGFSEHLVATALDRLGGLDIIVNNAGYSWDSVIQKMSDEQFDAMLDVHLKAPFRILRAATEHFRSAFKAESSEGLAVYRKVVNISSISGISGNPGQVNYAAAKAGIVGMTRTLAKEWGRYNVNVNAVAFGLVSTRMTQSTVRGTSEKTTVSIGDHSIPAGIPEDQMRLLEASIPLGRGATPEEAGGAILLLCLPESNYITGHVLMATGGL